eukprot:TRINITY_DN14769_c0_g1_i1.p1 TRINITY_DN14769_c0_g1~~TRINITY_DN14769_c0_g1_i1.p1  ORF type:complete len:250 (-),score=56.25 TRINITY_DN14769_c0_g1_i1:31-735(-)
MAQKAQQKAMAEVQSSRLALISRCKASALTAATQVEQAEAMLKDNKLFALILQAATWYQQWNVEVRAVSREAYKLNLQLDHDDVIVGEGKATTMGNWSAGISNIENTSADIHVYIQNIIDARQTEEKARLRRNAAIMQSDPEGAPPGKRLRTESSPSGDDGTTPTVFPEVVVPSTADLGRYTDVLNLSKAADLACTLMICVEKMFVTMAHDMEFVMEEAAQKVKAKSKRGAGYG